MVGACNLCYPFEAAICPTSNFSVGDCTAGRYSVGEIGTCLVLFKGRGYLQHLVRAGQFFHSHVHCVFSRVFLKKHFNRMKDVGLSIKHDFFICRPSSNNLQNITIVENMCWKHEVEGPHGPRDRSSGKLDRIKASRHSLASTRMLLIMMLVLLKRWKASLCLR